MRWKAHFYINGPVNSANGKKFGLPSKNRAPPVNELKAFEDDLVNMINNLSFRNVSDPFLNTINEDLKAVKSSDQVLIFADKTRNIYKTTTDNYNRLLTENITKSYKHGNNDMVDDINEELKLITKDLSIDDRVDIMAKKNAFITLKDHKENFESNPKCRLLNPTKSELGKISKAIVDNVNDAIRDALSVNQWKNTQSVIHWFKNIKN